MINRMDGREKGVAIYGVLIDKLLDDTLEIQEAILRGKTTQSGAVEADLATMFNQFFWYLSADQLAAIFSKPMKSTLDTHIY